MKHRILGIDEAGRGCLAGKLAISGVIFPNDVPLEIYSQLTDSKKISAKKRNYLYNKIKKFSNYHIVMFSSKEIDKYGISMVLRKGIIEILNNLKLDNTKIIYDGKFNPISDICIKEDINFNTMIKADLHIKEVAAASILSKVSRDMDILKLAKKYPEYDWISNKGYGTKKHINNIKKFGLSENHRKSFKIKSNETLF